MSQKIICRECGAEYKELTVEPEKNGFTPFQVQVCEKCKKASWTLQEED